MIRRPVGIDLFAGAGGMSLGFEQAGFDVAAAIEIDPIHCATHLFNFPFSKILPRSVVGLSAHDIRNASQIGDAVVDCVFGGPPCQGFSLIGQRSLEDPRNHLVLEFIRLVRELNARSFVFENVKGLTVGTQRVFLEEFIAECGRAGYEVVRPWQVLNAARFGVPQDRERLFLLGVRRGESLPSYPLPTTSGQVIRSLIEMSTPTCLDALGDLPDAEHFESLRDSDEVMCNISNTRSTFAASLRCETDDDWSFGYRRVWQSDRLTSSARTEHSLISRRRFRETLPGTVEPISRFYRLSGNGISNTLRAGTDGARGAFTSPRPIHFEYARCITVREMARLHGYPDWFRFHATKWHGARQVGNSVPPPLARAVASSVLASLGFDATRPSQEVSLGDPSFLRVEMSQAAALFSVPVPIQRRDRRSGSRKRSQLEVEASREVFRRA